MQINLTICYLANDEIFILKALGFQGLFSKWSGKQDLNLRSLRPERSALPN